jgi:hypothetical protein
MSERGQFKVTENGLEVASGEGPRAEAEREALHYLASYSEDGGDVRMYMRKVAERKAKEQA